MRKIPFIVIFGVLLSLLNLQKLYAGEMDILVNKLVEKGILTPVEAQHVLDETKKEAAREISKGKYSSLPEWVQKMKLKGDLRLRYQWDKEKSKAQRHRGRYRFRLGAETKVLDNVKVGFGLATGGSDPRSTNQTMTDSFQTPDIRLDYAYAEYKVFPYLILYGGKFHRKSVLWQPSDLLWDGDINPEGGALVIKERLSADLRITLEGGALVLNESSKDTSDPAMYFIQPVLTWAINKDVSLKSAFAYYGFSGIKGKSLEHSSNSNTGSAFGLVYNYNTINPSFELDIKEPFSGIVPFFGFFGEYVYNPDPDSDNKGYLLGFKAGNKKVREKGQWQIKYMFRRLEKDAWLDIFPDSDFYGGETNAKGHEAIFEYGLAKNVIFGVDYYYSKNIKGERIPDNTLQVDLVLKF